MRWHHRSLLGLGLLASAALTAPARAQVRPGIDVLVTDSAHLIAGQRLGLLTNQTGVDLEGRRDIDLLVARGYRLMVLFSPEHGLRGLEDRPGLPDATDSASGLPIYSLYGGTPLSHIALLDSLDAVLIDLQDIGARYYTYPASATQVVREAARRRIRVIVLDRPDPIGGDLVQGNVRDRVADPDSQFVGFLPIPMRHGLTLGELVRLAAAQLRLGANLTVVPAAGWQRGRYYDATGLPWVRPSPNMPDLESALHYPGTCLFEGTNLSVGRGTGFAFQVIGAPWFDTAAVLSRLRTIARGPGSVLAGVEISAAVFTPHAPTDGKYDGVPLRGVRLRVTDRQRY
ncbi:MAG TPA: DUF1343 domain-containing protein, partial [Gemmatimonadales bacterium]|nr:DUF1343 domain-containing protein [Gemmatimonadales bacterium]